MPLNKFHCPHCRGRLIAAADGGVACALCAIPVLNQDGILDFVDGRADTILDPAEYDTFHQLDAAGSYGLYDRIKHLSAERWPKGLGLDALGSTLEVGCGTGLLSRALIGRGETRDLVLTDISLRMLRTCRAHLEQEGLRERIPLTFATHGATEPCFRGAVFDTCAGGSVLHHIPDVRGFLASMFRWLKPGGRAFFMEPNLRFHRALAQTLADILALLYGRDRTFSPGRQALLNLICEWRRGILHQGDLRFLATLEDKHMFAGEAFEDMGHELGFAAVAAIPSGHDPAGVGIMSGLCEQLGIDEALRTEVLGLLPAFRGRYLALLSPREQSASFLLWLEKGVGPAVQRFSAPPAPVPPPPLTTPMDHLTGGLPARWSLELTATVRPGGLTLLLHGWCLLNTDIRWVRITLGPVAREAPVWMPRPDVYQAVGAVALYACWASLCCGVTERLAYDGVTADDAGVPLTIEIVLTSGGILPVPTPPRLILNETITVRQ